MIGMKIFKNKDKRAAQGMDVSKTLHQNLSFAAGEQYRLLRSNIQFTLPENVQCPVIGVTSSVRDEGKSTTSINLSYMLVEKGSKVLLIDADLRLPSIAKKMGLSCTNGLTDMLLGTSVDVESLRSDIHPDWYILTSGNFPPNPSELLGSGRMRRTIAALKEKFDYIVIDLPPVNLVSDTMSVADNLTGMIVVVREGFTGKRDLEQCFRQIRLSNIHVLGFVMNASEEGHGSYRKNGKYGKYKKYCYDSYEHDEPNRSADDTKAEK